MDYDAENVQGDVDLHHSVAGVPAGLWYLHHCSHLHTGPAEREATDRHPRIRRPHSLPADVRRTLPRNTRRE